MFSKNHCKIITNGKIVFFLVRPSKKVPFLPGWFQVLGYILGVLVLEDPSLVPAFMLDS